MTRYYLDTEFNGMGGDLISLALVADDGRELYLATKCYNPVPWVAANVMPIIGLEGAHPFYVKPHQFSEAIQGFLSDSIYPAVIADWPDDIRYFCQCLIIGPGRMINIPSIKMINIPSIKLELVRVDAYPTTLAGAVQHNALWDARALRHKIMGST